MSRYQAAISTAILFFVTVFVSNAGAQRTATDAPAPEVSQRMLFEMLGDESVTRDMLATISASLPVLSKEFPGSLPARMVLAANMGVRGPLLGSAQKRIVGGTLVATGEVPWQVALILKGYPVSSGQFCGGSIIAPEWILTAAHCVENMGPAQLNIYSGSVDLRSGGQVTEVKNIIMHKFDSNTMENDIAVLELEKPLSFSASASPIGIAPPKGDPDAAPGKMLLVSGWGAIRQGGPSPKELHKVVVPVVDINQCNSGSFYGGDVLKGMLCAGIGGKDSCQGDSGGPLVTGVITGGNPVQVGVVSWGQGCAQPNKPGVYADVGVYNSWIKSKIGIR